MSAHNATEDKIGTILASRRPGFCVQSISCKLHGIVMKMEKNFCLSNTCEPNRGQTWRFLLDMGTSYWCTLMQIITEVKYSYIIKTYIWNVKFKPIVVKSASLCAKWNVQQFPHPPLTIKNPWKFDILGVKQNSNSTVPTCMVPVSSHDNAFTIFHMLFISKSIHSITINMHRYWIWNWRKNKTGQRLDSVEHWTWQRLQKL